MPPSIALCTRELHPFIGGGIAPIVRALSDVLAGQMEVTLLTTAAHQAKYEELRQAGPVFDPRVRVVFVEEPPHQRGPFYSWLQAWSHRLYLALLDAFPDGGPDFVEFPDYLGEGFVTVQAKRTADRRLRATTVAARLHTTSEIVHVLNAHLSQSMELRSIYEMERYCLKHSDVLLWPGGDVHATYYRYYGAANLAPAVEIPDAFLVESEPPLEECRRDGPLKLLYLGRMERRKGVQNLVRALPGMEADHWQLTLLGGDTKTAPLASSLRLQLEAMTAGDERFELLDPIPRAEVGQVIAEHDAVVIPSLWECWPNVAREALLHARPVIGTPVGGLLAFVRPGESGWLARGTSAEALREAIEPLVRDPELVRDLAASGSPRRVLEELVDPDVIRTGYRQLVRPPRARDCLSSNPLVSVVVPYFELDDLVAETLASIASQTYSNLETIVVNDGSLRGRDRILDELPVRVVTQRNRGLGAARNIGIAAARGRFVLPLDADDLLEPEFVATAVRALLADDDLAYVGTWSRFVDEDGVPIEAADPGYAPFGNWSALTEEENVAGSATSLIRRHLFAAGFSYSHDLASYEDWLFYLQLRRAGHFGAIIPRPLLRYRIRDGSMLRATGLTNVERLKGEVAALAAEGAMQWTSPSV